MSSGFNYFTKKKRCDDEIDLDIMVNTQIYLDIMLNTPNFNYVIYIYVTESLPFAPSSTEYHHCRDEVNTPKFSVW